MTAIASWIDKSKGLVYMGGDGCASDEISSVKLVAPKIFIIGDFLIGYSGSLRGGQLVQYGITDEEGIHMSFEDLEVPLDDEDVLPFMVNDFVETLRAIFSRGGSSSMAIERGYAEEHFNEMIVGIKGGRVFLVQDDFSIIEPQSNSCSIGSGAYYCQGAFDAMENTGYTVDHVNPEEIVEIALMAAEKNSIGVSKPFSFLSI